MLGITLKDTVGMMNSTDYRERFIAEYWQTKIRYEKLKAFNTKIEAARRTICDPFTKKEGVSEPVHDCPEEILREQQSIMGNYLHILEVRALIESVDLELPFKARAGCDHETSWNSCGENS